MRNRITHSSSVCSLVAIHKLQHLMSDTGIETEDKKEGGIQYLQYYMLI